MKISFTGILELARAYQQAPVIVHDELTQMVDRLALVGAAESRRNVGVKSGVLQASIRPEPARFAGGQAICAWGSKVRYAQWHNDGTRPHIIRPRGRVLVFPGRDGGTVFARVVHHPGTKGRHFMTKGIIAVRRRTKAEGQFAAGRIAARLARGH